MLPTIHCVCISIKCSFGKADTTTGEVLSLLSLKCLLSHVIAGGTSDQKIVQFQFSVVISFVLAYLIFFYNFHFMKKTFNWCKFSMFVSLIFH